MRKKKAKKLKETRPNMSITENSWATFHDSNTKFSHHKLQLFFIFFENQRIKRKHEEMETGKTLHLFARKPWVTSIYFFIKFFERQNFAWQHR